MTTNETHSLKNQFLIAMPQLRDTGFSQSITFICDHSSQGAMGIVINRPLNITVEDIMFQVGIKEPIQPCHEKVYSGGPVQAERGFVLHRDGSHWDSTLEITHDISLTTSKDILEAIACNQGPDEFLIALGYAGWGPGQLENEMAVNAWLTVDAQSDIIFKTPAEQRWHCAVSQLGIDMTLVSPTAGHA